MIRASVVHCRESAFDVYIGRPGPWGNPYSHLPGKGDYTVASREDAVELYRVWMTTRLGSGEEGLADAIRALDGKALGCWCAPLLCHGNVLADLAEALR